MDSVCVYVSGSCLTKKNTPSLQIDFAYAGQTKAVVWTLYNNDLLQFLIYVSLQCLQHRMDPFQDPEGNL